MNKQIKNSIIPHNIPMTEKDLTIIVWCNFSLMGVGKSTELVDNSNGMLY